MSVAGRLLAMGVAMWLLPGAIAQSPVTEIQLRTDPVEARVRPLESIVVQVLAYSEISDGSGGTQKVRIQPASEIAFKLENDSAGWLSKPFRFQGQETEAFYEPEGTGLAAIIFRRATSQYVRQDSTLYTAPEKPGSYEIEAELEGKTAKISINVDANALSLHAPEKVEFPGEGASHDPYRLLAQHYAPFVAQETWFQPKSDYLARFDLDGDWRGDNNWQNAEEGSSQAYVYYAVMESQTHWFLIYNFFHPRDYSDKCVVGTCHENDNEGLILTVEKDGSQYGRLLSMETLAHNNIYSHSADSRVRSGIHNLDGDVELYEGSHPVVFIESGGHGVYGSAGSHARFTLRAGDFSVGTGVTYVYKGRAERPQHANDRLVGYELLPIYDHWWLPSVSGDERGRQMFDDYYQYVAYGRRPTPKHREIAGAFLGRMHGANKAKPFWGWHDNRTSKREVVAPGQWGLDPAYAVNQNLRMPQPFSLDYVFNPYLGIGQPPSNAITESQPAGTVTPSRGRGVSDLVQFQPKRSSDYDPNSRQGHFDLRFHVDHTMDIYVQGDVVRYSFEGQQPRDDGSEYSQPIPRAQFTRFEMEQRDGRGEITLLEGPTPENDYTAKLRITDSRGGDDRFHARLSWESTGGASNAAPAPSPDEPASGGSSVLSRHLEDLLKVTQGGESSTQPLSPPPAPAPVASPLPGVELSSAENDPRSYDSSAQGLLEFRGRVDGSVLFRIRGDRVFAEAEGGRPVEVERFSFSQPLPSSGLAEIEVEQRDGRGEVVLLERPWQGNDFTAVIRVSDPRSGDDRYHFRLQWRR